MGRPLLRREGRTAYLGVCTASSCVWKSYRRYGGKTLVGADMPVLHVPAGQGGGERGARCGRVCRRGGRGRFGCGVLVRQNRPQRFLPQCKRRSRRPLRRDAMPSGVPCRKTEYGTVILAAEQIWKGYPLLRNGIGRAALRQYKPAVGGTHGRGGRLYESARRLMGEYRHSGLRDVPTRRPAV